MNSSPWRNGPVPWLVFGIPVLAVVMGAITVTTAIMIGAGQPPEQVTGAPLNRSSWMVGQQPAEDDQ